jgi:predicted RNA-binding Zn-ribbon protein involved in translation (DUF1610 family)
MDTVVDAGADLSETGEFAVVGSLVCVGCGYSISLSAGDDLPTCPACGESRFRRASMFESSTLATEAITAAPRTPGWLEQARSELESAGHYLAYEEGDERVVVELQDGWTRIGRSGSADICLDDATAPRRTSCARSTTAASTACSSTASKSSGPRSPTGTSSRSAATGSTCSRRSPPLCHYSVEMFGSAWTRCGTIMRKLC